jgi:23S rRNA pseudouridine1911/1915/1917 synthase
MNLRQIFPVSVDHEGDGLRLDLYLATRFSEVSRSRWQRLIEKEIIGINGKLAKSSDILADNDELNLLSTDLLLDTNPLEILKTNTVYEGPEPVVHYEDRDLLVVDKPAGVAVHPGAGVSLEQTLLGWMTASQKLTLESGGRVVWDDDVLETFRPGIVHRLDKSTSGLMVLAKNPGTHSALQRQFADRSARRLYYAVVNGNPDSLSQRRPAAMEQLLRLNPPPLALNLKAARLWGFACYLDRDPKNRLKYAVSAGTGKKSITHFVVQSSTNTHSLLELKLGTGRTHQIRVHMAFLGFPVLGDDVYGNVPSSRMWLHSHRLTLVQPGKGKALDYSSVWPEGDSSAFAAFGLKLQSTPNDFASV